MNIAKAKFSTMGGSVTVRLRTLGKAFPWQLLMLKGRAFNRLEKLSLNLERMHGHLFFGCVRKLSSEEVDRIYEVLEQMIAATGACTVVN